MTGPEAAPRRWRGAPVVATLVTLVLASLPGVPAEALAQPSVITLVAGTGVAGDSNGAGGVATTADFASPVAIASADGWLTIADTDNCRIRSVGIAGLVTDLAGTGTCGAGGDDGPALAALLDHPSALARTPTGDLLVADTVNCTVRLVGLDGEIHRLAGADPAPTPLCGHGGDGGPATAALLDHPMGLAVGADGTVYVADTGNCRVRRIDAAGTITTVAGNGSCGYGGDGAKAHFAALDHPAGVAVDASGRVYVADTGNHRVRRIATGGNIVTVAGTGVPGLSGDLGPATAGLLHTPRGLALDSGGRLYVADAGNCRVRSVIGTTIRTVAGSTCGNAGNRVAPAAAQLGAVGAVSVTPGGDLVISDTGNHQVKVVDRVALRDPGRASAYTPLNEAFDAYGNANTSPRNWSGGDATYSLRLPDGRVAWLFADSFTGTAEVEGPGWVRPDHSRAGQGMIGNQLVIENPATTPPTFVNVWRPGAEGQDYFAPVDEYHRWWPFMPFLKNNAIMTVPLVSFDARTGLVDASAVVDIPLATLQPSAPAPTPGALIANPNAATGCNALIDHGDTVLLNPDGSGYTYVYGTEVCHPTSELFLHLARVPGRVLDRQPWQYFAGIDPGSGAPIWSSDPATSARLRRTSGAEIGDGGFEYSVVRTSTGYRMVHHLDGFGGEIAAAMASTPWGPFGDSVVIYRPPEHGSPSHANAVAGCGLTTYGAKEHPEFGNESELVLSYNVNGMALYPGGCAGWGPIIELIHNVDNYRPRFVRVPVSDGVAVPAPPA